MISLSLFVAHAHDHNYLQETHFSLSYFREFSLLHSLLSTSHLLKTSEKNLLETAGEGEMSECE